MSGIELGGRTAIVTGAGGGLGRQHALALASRGAAVVVNDLGGAVDGSGRDTTAAERVVAEIEALGGQAVADAHSVSDPEGARSIVETALRSFGGVDILVNNAGILQDRSFHNMTVQSFDAVIGVHLRGSFNVTRAAWPHLRDKRRGRIVCTASASGVFGNFGQANYAAAKSGLIGFTKTLAIEGAKYGITANAIAPIALTRMTEKVLGPYFVERVLPELVSPLVVWLASDDCDTSGNLYTAGGGRVARFAVAMSPGWTRNEGQLTPEDIRDHWAEINDLEGCSFPTELNDDFRALKKALSAAGRVEKGSGA